MRQSEAISQGVCPQCFGQRIIWQAMAGSSAWCSCCGGTGLYPPPADSHGDGIYEAETPVPVSVVHPRRESRYRVKAPDKLETARKKQRDLVANPNNADGDYSGIKQALGKLDPTDPFPHSK